MKGMMRLKVFPKNTSNLLCTVNRVTAPAITRDLTRAGAISASCLAKIVPKETPIKCAGGSLR